MHPAPCAMPSSLILTPETCPALYSLFQKSKIRNLYPVKSPQSGVRIHTPIFKPRSEVPDISCRKTTALDLSTTTHAGKRQFVDGAGWLYVRRGRWPSDMVLRPRKAVFLFPDNFCADTVKEILSKSYFKTTYKYYMFF